jgi:hypothetical protein
MGRNQLRETEIEDALKRSSRGSYQEHVSPEGTAFGARYKVGGVKLRAPLEQAPSVAAQDDKEANNLPRVFSTHLDRNVRMVL